MGAVCFVWNQLKVTSQQHRLSPLGLQVAVPAALVEVVRHGQACQWKLAEAAPLDDLSAGSFSGGSTAEGHQGYWVAQQAGSLLPPLLARCLHGPAQ